MIAEYTNKVLLMISSQLILWDYYWSFKNQFLFLELLSMSWQQCSTGENRLPRNSNWTNSQLSAETNYLRRTVSWRFIFYSCWVFRRIWMKIKINAFDLFIFLITKYSILLHHTSINLLYGKKTTYLFWYAR